MKKSKVGKKSMIPQVGFNTMSFIRWGDDRFSSETTAFNVVFCFSLFPSPATLEFGPVSSVSLSLPFSLSILFFFLSPRSGTK